MDLMGSLTLLGQHIPDAMAEFLETFRQENKAPGSAAEYAGVGSMVSAELAKLTAATRELQRYNAARDARQRREWGSRNSVCFGSVFARRSGRRLPGERPDSGCNPRYRCSDRTPSAAAGSGSQCSSILPASETQDGGQMTAKQSSTGGPETMTNPFDLILPFVPELAPHILDPEISEICLNSNGTVYVERHGVMERIGRDILEPKKLMFAVQRIARQAGEEIDDARPYVDARLPDGSRVAAVIPPCSVGGATVTIRKFQRQYFGLARLVELGTLNQETAPRCVPRSPAARTS